MGPDVTTAERAEYRVGQGMQQDIPVRMRDNGQSARDRHAAKHQRPVILAAETMDIIAPPHARDRDLVLFQSGKVFGSGDLDVGLLAGDGRNLGQSLDHARIIGDVQPSCSARSCA